MLRPRSARVVLSLGLATVLLLTTAAGAGAATASGASTVQVASEQAQRSVQIWMPGPQPHEFGINSVSLGTPVTDEFQLSYAKGSFTLDYERSAGGPVTSTFTATIQGLYEWRGSSDTPFSESEVVTYTPLGAAAFGTQTIQHTETTVDGVLVHSFLIKSDDGSVVMNLTIAQGFLTVAQGHTQTPMEAELTLQVNHMMTESDTSLALQVSISTPQAPKIQNRSWDDEHAFAQNERAINVTNESGGIMSSTFFAWSNDATVNGQVGTVSVSGPMQNASGAYDLYFMYPRFASSGTNPNEFELEHDPSLGVVSVAYASIPAVGFGPIQGIQADLPLYAVSVAAVAALVGGTAILSRRRRERP